MTGRAFARLIDQPAALVEAATASVEQWSAYGNAIGLLNGVADDEIELLQLILHGIVVEYLAFRGSRTSGSAVRKAWRRLVQHASDIEEQMAVLSVARQAFPAHQDPGASLHALYAAAVEALLPGAPLPEWDHDDLGQTPHARRFSTMVADLELAAEKVGLASLAIPDRSPDIAFDRLVDRLAQLWTDRMMVDPTAASKSTEADFRSPFAAFIVAVWGGIDRFPPSNQTISRALGRRYSTSSSK